MDKEHKILLDALGFDPADLDTSLFAPDSNQKPCPR